MFFLVLWALGLITAIVDMVVNDGGSDLSNISSTLLLHQFVVTFGLLGLIGFYINIAKAKETAEKLGWPGGPFQVKYGFSQVGLGIMGLMAIWFRGPFWLGVIVSMYIYGISGLWSHVNEMKRKNNMKDISSISNIIMDILYQAFITVLSLLAGGIWVFS